MVSIDSVFIQPRRSIWRQIGEPFEPMFNTFLDEAAGVRILKMPIVIGFCRFGNDFFNVLEALFLLEGLRKFQRGFRNFVEAAKTFIEVLEILQRF